MWDQIIICTVKFFAELENQEKLAKSPGLTGESFVLDGGDKRSGWNYCPSLAM